jgi:hypothetical protein
MSYYEIRASGMAFSGVGVLSTAGDKLTFRGDQLAEIGLSANDGRLTVVADTLEQWAEYVRTPGSDYTPLPTSEEIEAMTQTEIDSKKQQIHAAVKAARLRYIPDIPLQDMAYRLKAEIAAEWDGNPPPPRNIEASAERFGLTAEEAQARIAEKAALYPQMLMLTEALREEGEAIAAQNGDISGVLSALAAV